jgi:hypothetical protein
LAISTGRARAVSGERGEAREKERKGKRQKNSRRGEDDAGSMTQQKWSFLPAALFAKVLLLDAGTAVLTGDADLFLDARLLTGRGFDLGLESELTFFPSGVRRNVDL